MDGKKEQAGKQAKEVLQNVIEEGLDKIIASGSRDKERALRVTLRPVRIGEKLVFQETLFRGNQVYHSNLEADQAVDKFLAYVEEGLFSQIQIMSSRGMGSILTGKKGRIRIKLKSDKGGDKAGEKAESEEPGSGKTRERDLSHDREKQYILPRETPIPFLVHLGVQHAEGGIVKARYDKFRQINRYLEFIRDLLPVLEEEEEIHIVDFGCGKSYLTFAMYYYLHELRGLNVRITGLDLKKEVIARCKSLAREYGYEALDFRLGDISQFESREPVHMVVSLHACDKATDFALEKAVKWGAKVILAVPCCQHELNRQISNRTMEPILKYGIIKERMAALLTDAIRASILEEQGYDTQILEFIDMEHTPKNLLIRAVRSGKIRSKKPQDLGEVMKLWNVSPTLYGLLER